MEVASNHHDHVVKNWIAVFWHLSHFFPEFKTLAFGTIFVLLDMRFLTERSVVLII